MKRFYCTVCRKVKRVRRLPATRPNAETHAAGGEKAGVCLSHSAQKQKAS